VLDCQNYTSLYFTHRSTANIENKRKRGEKEKKIHNVTKANTPIVPQSRVEPD